MEKLTSILAVVESKSGGRVVFDKATCIARAVGAQVRLLVLDSKLTSEFASLCNTCTDVDIVITSMGAPGESTNEAIRHTALLVKPDLVITHVSAGASLRRMALDNSAWQLVHECPVPVLLVRNRKWRDSPRFAAAVDVAARDRRDLARSILHAAGFLALECGAELDVLYSEPEQHDSVLRMERAVELARMVREFRVGCERIQHFAGDPEATLPGVAQAQDYDCIVLRSLRSRGLPSLREGVTSRLFDATQGDLLFIKPEHESARHSQARRAAMPAAVT